MKKRKNKNTHENIFNSQTGKSDSQTSGTESVSLLKPTIKKHKKSKKNRQVHLDKVQSESFLQGVNMSMSQLTDVSSKSDSQMTGDKSKDLGKRKKRKIKDEKYDEPPEKKRNAIELPTQDVFKQANPKKFFMKFFTSTPSTTRKIRKKKYHLSKEETVREIDPFSQDSNGNKKGKAKAVIWDNEAPIEATKLTKKKKKHTGLSNSILDELDSNFASNRSSMSPEFIGAGNHNRKKRKDKSRAVLNYLEKDAGVNEFNGDDQELGVYYDPVTLDRSRIKKADDPDESKYCDTDEIVWENDGISAPIPTTEVKKKKKKDKGLSNSICGELGANSVSEEECILPEFSQVHIHEKKKRKHKSSVTSNDLKKDADVNEFNGDDQELGVYDPVTLDRSTVKEADDPEESKHSDTEEIVWENDGISSQIPSTELKKKKKKHKGLSNSILSELGTNSVSEEECILPELSPAHIHEKKKRKHKSSVISNDLKKGIGVNEHDCDRQELAICDSVTLDRSRDSPKNENADLDNSGAKVIASSNLGIGEVIETDTTKKNKEKHTHLSTQINELVSSCSTQNIESSDFNGSEKHNHQKIKESESILVEPKEETAESIDDKSGLIDIEEHFLGKWDIHDVSNNSNENCRDKEDCDKEAEEVMSSSDEGVEDNDRYKSKIFKGSLVDVDFEIPELHKLLNRASKPSPDQRTKMAAEGIRVKYGKFTKAEDAQIRENWKHFIAVNYLDDVPDVFFCLDKRYISTDAKRTFLYYLSRNMTERTPFSVYNRFKILMGQTKSGRFTEEENDYIFTMLRENEGRRNCVTEIAEHLNRPLESIEKRLKIIRNAHSRKIKWKKRNAAAFIKYLLKVTKIREEDIEKLKQRHITSEEWRKLSEKLDDVPARILKRVWLEILHPALFLPTDSCDIRKIKFKLIKLLYDNNETEWRTVNWSSYTKHFEGFTHSRLYSFMKQLVFAHVPAAKYNDLKKCLEQLIEVKEKDIRKRMIFKIKYSQGKVEDLNPEG